MYHVLRRQLTPRHSPSALVAFDLCCRELVASRVTVHDVSRHLLPTRCLQHRAFFTLLFSSSYSLVKVRLLRTPPSGFLRSVSIDKTTRHLVGPRKLTVTCLSTGYAVSRASNLLKSVCLSFHSHFVLVCPANVWGILIALLTTVKGHFSGNLQVPDSCGVVRFSGHDEVAEWVTGRQGC